MKPITLKDIEDILEPLVESVAETGWPKKEFKLATSQLMVLIESERLEAIRADRLANARFWKGNIDKMFDKEIRVYEQTDV